MFQQHLPQPRIGDLVDAFTASGVVYDGAIRSVLFGGVEAAFVGLLPVGLPPRFQLMGDLNRLNALERLADGSIPLVIWLRNAAALLKGTKSAEEFLKALDEVERRVTGSPAVDVASLPERQEALVHEDDMVPFGFMSGGVAAARSVAKLMVPRFENGVQKMTPDPVIYLGTGWLIAGHLLVTNHHVINARSEGEPAASPGDFKLQALATKVIFDYDADDVQGTESPVSELLASDDALDYALLRLPATNRPGLPIAKTPLTKTAARSIAVNVIQHPAGRGKKFGIRNNLVSAATATELRYFTDTLAGSSGSPVLDDLWTVVALHRAAAYAEDVKFNGRPTAWVNVGTPIHAVVADIKTRRPDLAGTF